MAKSITFRGLLLVTLLLVSLGSMGLVAGLLIPDHNATIKELSEQLTRQTLNRVADRLDELVRITTDHAQLYARLTPQGELSSEDFPQLFSLLWTTIDPHPELSYLGVGIAETGEYGMVRHLAGEPIGVRTYVRDPETGPQIRDYSATRDGLSLSATQPWLNNGNPRVSYVLKLRPFFDAAAKARRSVWTDSYAFWGGSDRGETPGVSYATPIYDEHGALRVVWDIDLELVSLSRFLDRVKERIAGELLIIEHRTDGSWKVLARAHGEKSSNQGVQEREEAIRMFLGGLPQDDRDIAQADNQLQRLTIAGEPWQATWVALHGPDRPRWLVAGIWSAREAPHVASLGDRHWLVAFGLTGLVAGICAWWLSRQIARPLQQLESEARALAAGDKVEITWLRGPEEFHRLAMTFNYLAIAVQQRQLSLETINAQLRMSQERLQVHFDKTPVGAIEVDPQGRLVGWNAAAERIFGWKSEEVFDKPYEIIVPQDQRQDVARVVESAMNRSGGFRNQNQNLTKDGRIIDCEWYNTPLVDLQGRTFGIACLVLDITQRVRSEAEIRRLNGSLESRVRKRTRELRSAMRDLESFSYSVAHDLRAPLRSINGFSQALADDEADRLSPQGRNFLNRIRLATRNMAELIDALLRLARVARQEVQQQRFDLSELVAQTLNAAILEIPNRRITVTIARDLWVTGDRELIRSLLINVCDNALKYSRSREETRIDFVFEDRLDGRWYGVADNGIGFEGAYAHKAIQPFQRLHAPEDFEGHGIGLATASRIAQKHGGELHLVSRPEGGAICWFRLTPGEDSGLMSLNVGTTSATVAPGTSVESAVAETPVDVDQSFDDSRQE